MCVDSLGHIFLTGVFLDSSSFGGHLINGSSHDMFLVKYDSTGSVLWALSAGGTTNYTEGYRCAADNYGNIFVTGGDTGSYLYIGNDTLTYSGAGGLYLAKYDSSGNFLWAEGSDDAGPNAIATDSAGNVFISGSFISASVSFGSYTLFNSAPGLDHTFLAKYDSSGNVLWAHAPTGSWDEGLGLATDRNGNIYMTGYFVSAQITFGTITLSRVPNADSDLFVVKYDANGSVIWAKRAGNTSFNEAGYGIAVDIYSDIYITGYFADTVALSFGNSSLTTNGLSDVFLAKLTHTVGTEEIISPISLTVFPNPSAGQINIRYSGEIDEIKITDLLGQIIYQSKPKEKYLPLLISGAGIYFISVRTGTRVLTKKLIVSY
jgi:hypothetical protein